MDAAGRYTYRDPETGAVHGLHWLFGWLYLWTPLLLLVTALVLLVVLVLGLVADWMRRRDGDQRAKAIGSGEVIYEVAAAKRRETGPPAGDGVAAQGTAPCTANSRGFRRLRDGHRQHG